MLIKSFKIHKILIFSLLILFTTIKLLAIAYEVGPGMTYENIGDVPLENLNPGDSVQIHYRPNPYCEKWVVSRTGTVNANIIFHGIPGSGGELPIIDGRNATTRQELNYWSEERGIINIGGSSFPNQDPDYIIIENLDIRSARTPFTFIDDNGQVRNYSDNAASFYVVSGNHIIIRNCILHDCGNGFFVSHQSSNITVEGCYIYDNGIEGSYYQHNNYTSAKGIIFQYNHFGPLRSGCDGNNLKDRSCGTVIRYNWIEGGNRQLDLVESSYPEIYNDPSYRETFVYGNVLIEQTNEGNSQICHYGGDGSTVSYYRKGILYFYNNTVISKRTGNTTLFRLSTNDEFSDARNNIVYVTENGNRLALLSSYGVLNIRNNWFKTGWVESHQGGSYQGTVFDSGGIVTGNLPGFANYGYEDFHLATNSPCINTGTSLNSNVLPDHNVIFQYIKHCQKENRPYDGIFDIGSYEYQSTGVSENNVFFNSKSPLIYREENYIIFKKLSSGNVIKMYDISGKLLHNSENIINDTYRWNISNIKSGIYFYFIEGIERISGKIIILE